MAEKLLQGEWKYAGQWSASAPFPYMANTVVMHNGQLFISDVDFNTTTPTTSELVPTDWSALSGGVGVWKGAWATSTAYIAGDLVSHSTTVYRVLNDHTSSTDPSVDTTNYAPFMLYATDAGAGANTIALRTTGGRLVVGTPTGTTDATTKQYVDAKTWDAATDLTGTLANGNLPGRLQEIAATVTDWNSALSSGFYRGNNASNAPGASSWYYGMVISHDNGNYVKQVASDYYSNNTYTRIRSGGTWGAWVQTSGDNGAVPGEANFTQQAASALPSAYGPGIRVQNTGGDASFPATYASLYTFSADNGARIVQMCIKSASSATTPTLIWVRSSASSSTWGDWVGIGGGNAGAWRSDHTYKSGYSTHGSYPVRFRRDGDFIYMAGLLARSSVNWSANATDSGVVTLPADSRPERSDFYPGASNENQNESCTFVATTGGTIDIRTGAMGSVAYNAAYFSMNSIIFYSPQG